MNLSLWPHRSPGSVLGASVLAVKGRSVRVRGMLGVLRGLVGALAGHTSPSTVACARIWALGGVDFVDLDTAFLLASDPYDGGWTTSGPELTVRPSPGLGVRARKD